MTTREAQPAVRRQNGSVWIDHARSTWDVARVPIMSDALLRSLSVFDGLVAVADAGGRLELVAGEAHVRRLRTSARVIGLSHGFSARAILDACLDIATAERDATGATVVYVRPMLVGARVTDASEAVSLVVTAFEQPRYFDDAPPVSMATSPLRRPSGDSMSPFVKASANYHLTRLARLQAAGQGFDEALFLNASGRVAEAAGSAVLFELSGALVTPPASEDCLPSITVDMVEDVARDAGVPFERRPVTIAEAYAADGIATVGTLAAMQPVSRLDHVSVPGGSLLSEVRKAYLTELASGTRWRAASAPAVER